MNHLVKKAAVAKYGPLYKEGKAEAEVKAAIAADAKSFPESEVNEIYDAIVDAAAKDGGDQGSNGGDQSGDDKDNGDQGNAGGDAGDGDQGGENNGPQDPPPPFDKSAAYVVVERFRDALNRRKVYEAGEDVSHLDEARLESLLEKGLVEKQ